MPAWTDMQFALQPGATPLIDHASYLSRTHPGLSVARLNYFVVPRDTDFPTFQTSVVGTITPFTDRLIVAQSTNATALTIATQALLQSPPYCIEAICGMNGMGGATDSIQTGICVSDGTKFKTVTASCINFSIRTSHGAWTTRSALTLNSNVGSTAINPTFYGLRITDDGTTRNYYFSGNCRDWINSFSEPTNTFLTPTQFGLSIYNNNGINTPMQGIYYHFALRPDIPPVNEP